MGTLPPSRQGLTGHPPESEWPGESPAIFVRREVLEMIQRKLPDFRIVIYRDIELVSEIAIPANRIGPQDLDCLLRVLYARYSQSSDSELASFFVNRRKGLPTRHPLHQCKTTIDWQKKQA